MTEEPLEIPIACTKLEGVFSAKDFKRHAQIWETMETQLKGIDELDSGYAFRFPLDDNLFKEIAEYVIYERLCCPFFKFNLEMDPAEGYVRLNLTGAPGVKEYLAQELAERKLDY